MWVYKFSHACTSVKWSSQSGSWLSCPPIAFPYTFVILCSALATSSPQATNDLPLLEISFFPPRVKYKWNFVVWTFFGSSFFHLAQSFWDSSLMLEVSIDHPFILLSTISLCGCNVFPSYLLMDISLLLFFWLLLLKLWTLVYSFYMVMFSFLLR